MTRNAKSQFRGSRVNRVSEQMKSGSDLEVRLARDVRLLFRGSRLRVARELRGLSQKTLAELVAISAAAIGQFEKGATIPTARTLVSLSNALDFPLEFFRDDAAGQRDDVPAFFRSLRSVRAIERKQARAFADVVRQFAVGLESYVELPPLDVPRIPVTSQDVERVEDIASRVRQEWGLNSDQPLSDLVVELERHGIIVTRATFDTEKMDAFSVAFEDHPVVVLCSDKGLRDRSRFDAAHELGHLVMHDPEVCGMRWAESQANRFAAAFLMPSEGIAAELPATPEWPRLVSLKRKWGVSIAALLVRARTLGIMAPEVQIQAFKTLSARGWRTSEPEPLGPPETPKLLRNAIRMLDNSAIPGEQLVELTAIPMDQIARIYAANAPPRPKVEL